MTHKVGAKGQVLIPKDIRDELGLLPGDEVMFRQDGRSVVVSRVGDIHSLRGIFKGSNIDKTLDEERRLDRIRDERNFDR